MKLQGLFSTPEREKILQQILAHPSRKIKISQLAEETGLSLGFVSNYVNMLRKKGVAREKLEAEKPEARALKQLVNVNVLVENGVVEVIRKNLPGVTGIGVYGSWANGTNYEDSDLDIWVKAEKKPADPVLAKTRRKIEERLGTKTTVLILSKQRLRELVEKDKPFYSSLFHSFRLWGESI